MLLAFLTTFSSFAQNTLESVDFSVLDPIRPVQKKNPNRAEKLIYLMKLKREALKKEIMNSGEYLAVIQSGAILESVENDSDTFKVNKDINVYVFRQADHEGFKYIVGKDKKIKYKIHTKYLVDISVVSDLNPKPETWSEVKEPVNLFAEDKLTKLKLQFNLHSEAINSRYLQEVAEERYDQVNHSLRFETQSYLHWDYPMELGWSLNYQAASFTTVNTSGGIYRAFHTGPILRTRIGTFKDGDLLLHFSYQRSLNGNYSYRINDTSYIALLSVNTAEIGTEWMQQNSWGRFSIGLAYRREWISLKQNLDDSVRVSSASRTADSLGISLGQDFDWNL
ncbi:MAG: hypothetical protein ACOYL6_02605 [Bacteriovoracaceae bacterium]